jgi:hypothetical protein
MVNTAAYQHQNILQIYFSDTPPTGQLLTPQHTKILLTVYIYHYNILIKYVNDHQKYSTASKQIDMGKYTHDCVKMPKRESKKLSHLHMDYRCADDRF